MRLLFLSSRRDYFPFSRFDLCLAFSAYSISRFPKTTRNHTRVIIAHIMYFCYSHKYTLTWTESLCNQLLPPIFIWYQHVCFLTCVFLSLYEFSCAALLLHITYTISSILRLPLSLCDKTAFISYSCSFIFYFSVVARRRLDDLDVYCTHLLRLFVCSTCFDLNTSEWWSYDILPTCYYLRTCLISHQLHAYIPKPKTLGKNQQT